MELGPKRRGDQLAHRPQAGRNKDEVVEPSQHRDEVGNQVNRRQRIGCDGDREQARERGCARITGREPGGVRFDGEAMAEFGDAFGKGFTGHGAQHYCSSMAIQLKSARVERWPVAGEFVIARGAQDHVDLVVAEIESEGIIGRGEGTPIYYRGEGAAGCRDAILRVVPHLAGMDVVEARAAVQELLDAGAARNALDCALWDLEARQRGVPLWRLAGCDGPPTERVTAITISLAPPDRMRAEAAAAVADGWRLLKLKLTGEGDRARVKAVREGAPDARLIVDANESWGQLDLLSEAEGLAELGVELIEQPVPVGADALLDGVYAPLPFVADESCQTAADIARIGTFYDGVNIKLDKAGGLTEALRLADAADAAGLGIMVGCMLSTSLGIAPAFVLAQRAQWVDLDGPALLARDREEGFTFEGGCIRPLSDPA